LESALALRDRALGASVEVARRQAREQLEAAWQLHVSRVEEQLHSGWNRHLEQLLDERFQALAEELEKALEEKAAAAAAEAVRNSHLDINQFTRRMREAVTQQEWSAALIDAARSHAAFAALFTLQSGILRLDACTQDVALPPFPLASAPAMAAAAGSMDPIAAGKALLFPLCARSKAVALLYATGADHSRLELLSTVAGLVWESRTASTALVSIQPAEGEATDLARQAQRFARVHVAEMRLYQSGEVKQGRLTGTLYAALRESIEQARQDYREQFLTNSQVGADYLHEELVRTLANGDPSLFGAEYPGPLV
jgi:hypothetical protein